MSTRRSTEEGHSRKFLVVMDNTEECERALYFAGRRAAHSGGTLLVLTVIEPAEFQHWMGVEAIMREEAMQEARALLDRAVEMAVESLGVEPETAVREGYASQEILALIEEDQDIAVLVLGAGVDGEGPGPLVAGFANNNAAPLPIPVTIVPGSLTNQELDAIT